MSGRGEGICFVTELFDRYNTVDARDIKLALNDLVSLFGVRIKGIRSANVKGEMERG